MSAPQNCLRIAPEVAKALGKTPEQLAALTLGEFQILAKNVALLDPGKLR